MHHKSIMYNKPTGCNSGSIVFINNYMLLETVLQQNYFSFQNNTYQPAKGILVGSPISNTVAEIFLQHLENTHLKHILESKHIIFYTRYADDILMIYNTKYTIPETIHQHINKTHLHTNTKTA